MAKLFLSPEGRRKQKRRDRRRAFRQAENAVDDVKDRIKELDREAKKQWEKARNETKAGQKAAAQRLLTSYRAAQIHMTKLEQKRWVFEQYVTKMKMAQTDVEFSNALKIINKVTEINPEEVVDIFESAQDKLGEQLDADRFWEKLYDKEMEGATGTLEDYIPPVEELDRQLQEEAAAEVGGGTKEAAGALEDQIGKGQERIKNLLDDK